LRRGNQDATFRLSFGVVTNQTTSKPLHRPNEPRRVYGKTIRNSFIGLGHGRILVGPAGIEPATVGLEIRCSIPLSYGPAGLASLLASIVAQPVRQARLWNWEDSASHWLSFRGTMPELDPPPFTAAASTASSRPEPEIPGAMKCAPVPPFSDKNRKVRFWAGGALLRLALIQNSQVRVLYRRGQQACCRKRDASIACGFRAAMPGRKPSASPLELTIKIRIGGRYRIRTYDFHRVKMALYR
jgi:hypothetical protein